MVHESSENSSSTTRIDMANGLLWVNAEKLPAIGDVPGLRLDPPEVHSNLVWFAVEPEFGTPKDVQDQLKKHGVLVSSSAPGVCRACTHLDVSAAQAERAADVIRKTLRKPVHV